MRANFWPFTLTKNNAPKGKADVMLNTITFRNMEVIYKEGSVVGLSKGDIQVEVVTTEPMNIGHRVDVTVDLGLGAVIQR